MSVSHSSSHFLFTPSDTTLPKFLPRPFAFHPSQKLDAVLERSTAGLEEV